MSAKTSHLGPLRREAAKLRALKRTYWGAAGLLIIPFFIALGIYLSSHNSAGDNQSGDPTFLIKTFMNGLYVPPAALAIMSVFLFPLAAAMIGGFMIAGEAEAGTLRTMLVRPVRRGAVLLSKWATAVIYLGIVMLLVALVGLIAGWAFFGIKPMLLLGGEASVWPALLLIVLAYLFVLACMTCVISIALLFSTLTDSSLVAAVVTISITLVVQIVLQFSYFKGLRPYWFMNHFDGWFKLFQTPIAMKPIRDGLIAFAAYSAVPTALAYLRFRRKDITS
jgi:ABC-2 type transport system permease protein